MAQAWAKKFAEVTAKPHFEQAVWWLNGFWEDGAEAEAEKVWEITHLIVEVETGRKVLYGKRRVEVESKGDLDEMQAHVFLEKMGETLTVRALRKRLSDMDIDNNKRMSLSEYLLARYNKTPAALANSDQGSGVNPAELAEAQARFDRLNEQFAELVVAKERADAAATQAAKDKKISETALALANQKAAAAKAAAEELKKLEAELQVAVDAVKAEEKKIADKLAELEAIANDEGAGAVKKNKAKNEIAQIKGEDPLPLRKAKITQEAALKRAERARQPATDARNAADAEAAAAADAAARAARSLQEAEEAKADLARRVVETQRAVAEAEAVLQELKSRKGTPHGKIWWMERTLRENQKFMPK